MGDACRSGGRAPTLGSDESVYTILFFDDWHLERRETLERHVGKPHLVAEGTFEDPYGDPAWGFPRVHRDPETDRWRCYYQAQLSSGRFVPVLAESEDGIRWEVPDLSDEVQIADRLTPHQLFGIERFREWSGAYADPHAIGTNAWLKGLVTNRSSVNSVESLLVTSADGTHWSYAEGVSWHPYGVDPAAHPFWNPYRDSYVLTVRPYWADRRVAMVETKDWHSFTEPEWALQADGLDSPCAQVYGMPVVPYEHMFVGLLWVYHTDPAVDRDMKYHLGRIDCQLSYSLNGWHFQRTVREPFLPNAEPGEYGAGCIYPSSLIVDGDAMRIYSSASVGEHAQTVASPESRNGAILLHTLRKDGFVYLEPPGGTGELVTRLLLWNGGEPSLNATATHGRVQIQVMDKVGKPIEGYRYEDCQPFEGDSTSWVPRFQDGRRVAELSGEILRLGVRLLNSRLYAMRGDFEVRIAAEARAYTETGVRQPLRPGF